jgi:Arc/MetJ-type ribon-helix-helix transcriptional regulator
MFSLRLPAETREAVDRWAAAQEDRPGRSEAIRRLLNQALGVGTKHTEKRKTAKSRRAGSKRES